MADCPIGSFRVVFALAVGLVACRGERTTLGGPVAIHAPVSAPPNDTPPVVGEVEPASPAEQAGLHAGDRIVAVDDQQVETWSQLVAQLRARGPNQTVRLTVLRGRKKLDVPVALGSVATPKGPRPFLGVVQEKAPPP